MNRRASVLVAVSLLLAGGLSFAASELRDKAVGTWYNEYVINNKADPLAGQIDSWKSVSRRRADGRMEVHFRDYKDNKVVKNTIETRAWGVDGKVYWTQCISVVEDGVKKDCSGRIEYDIQEITKKEMAYTSRTSGRIFRVKRVADNFKLP